LSSDPPPKPLSRNWLIPLTIGILLLAAGYAFVRPALVRKSAAAKIKALGGNSTYPSHATHPSDVQPRWYWKRVERFDIDPITYVYMPRGVGDDRSLQFLRSLPELEEIELAFTDLSDDFITGLIRECPKLKALTVDGSFAGDQTVAALLEDPERWERLGLAYCPISVPMADALVADLGFRRRPASPLSPAARNAAQALGEGVISMATRLDDGSTINLFLSEIELEAAEADRHLRVLLHDLDPFHRIEVAVQSQQVTRAAGWFADLSCGELRLGNGSGDLAWLRSFKNIDELSLPSNRDHFMSGDKVKNGLSLEKLTVSGEAGWPFKGENVLPSLLGTGMLEHVAIHIKNDRPERMWRDLGKLRTRRLSLTADDAGFAQLAPMPELDILYLHKTGITDAALPHLARHANLRFLSLRATAITDQGVDHLRQLTKLERLYLNQTQITDAALPSLLAHPNLRLLSLKETAITDMAFMNVDAPIRLDTIVLDTTAIADRTLATLAAHAPQLKKLRVRNTGVTDKGVEALRGHPSLSELYLENVAITDACLDALAGIPSLKDLSIYGTSITTIQPLQSVPKLEYLNTSKLVSAAEKEAFQKARPKVRMRQHGTYSPYEEP